MEPTTDVFGASASAEWFCSADNELCAVKSGPWPAGGWKVGWRKPMGSELIISGQRLDAAGSPLAPSVPGGYGGTFQASGLIFPSAGCWEVEAQAGASNLRFVVEVGEPERRPRGGACDTLAAASDPFQLFCPERTQAEVVDGQAIPLNETAKANPLWSEATVTAIRGEIQAILRVGD